MGGLTVLDTPQSMGLTLAVMDLEQHIFIYSPGYAADAGIHTCIIYLHQVHTFLNNVCCVYM